MNHQPRPRSQLKATQPKTAAAKTAAAKAAGAKATRADAVRGQLEQDILTGRFPAGTHLDETAVADRLGCSRTPVREALNQLVALGLLERRNHCGVYVASRDQSRLNDLIEAYAEIEILCASMAIARLSGDERQALSALRDDPPRLWGALLKECGNRTMTEMAHGLRARIMSFGGGGDYWQSEADAAKILAAAVLDGDPCKVAEIIRQRRSPLLADEGVAA